MARTTRSEDLGWEHPFDVAVVAAAGPIAEVGLAGKALPDGCHSDLSKLWTGSAREARQRYPNDDDDKDKIAVGVEGSVLATRLLIETWTAVESLTSRLEKHQAVAEPCRFVATEEAKNSVATARREWSG